MVNRNENYYYQVRTGKFRPERDEHHPTVTPDLIVDNLNSLVDVLLLE